MLTFLLAAALSATVQSGTDGQPVLIDSSAVVADRGVVVSRTDTLAIDGSMTVAESLGHIRGVTVNDSGGAAGLKTVSLRGLGSAHTAIYVDGIRVGNVQSGQTDLGLLGAEEFSSVTVDYAQNSISLQSAAPKFGSRAVAGAARFRAGSFGTYEPSGRLDFRLDASSSLSAYASGIISAGNFPYGDGMTRTGNDLRQVRAGIDARGVTGGGDWHAKAYYNFSDRGTPGAVDWPSTDRQKDNNFLAQGVLRKQFTPLYFLTLSAKYSHDDLQYLSEWGNSRYVQNEAQFNSSHRFSIKRWLSASLAADIQYDRLASDSYNASRLGVITAAAVKFNTRRFAADLALEYSGTFDFGPASEARADGGSTNAGATDAADAVATGHGSGSAATGGFGGSTARHCLSPSADLRFRIVPGLDITAFARRACRVPVFNELYYPGFGNASLKAEDAWLTDVGVQWNRTVGGNGGSCGGGDGRAAGNGGNGNSGGWRLMAKADGFCNFLKDKIVSAPSAANPSIWYPYNIGRSRMAGLDLAAGFSFSEGTDAGAPGNSLWTAAFSAGYEFLDAVDLSAGGGTSGGFGGHGQQIPFTARHSLTLDARCGCSGWSLDLCWNLRCGRSGSVSPISDWNSLDLTAGKVFAFRSGLSLELEFIARNLTDCRYELSEGYPMPGRSFYGAVEFKF